MVTYLTDNLISSCNMEEHPQHLQQVFQIQQENGLIDNALKRLFGQSQLQFFIYRISPEGIMPLVENIETIQNFPNPQRTFVI